MVPSRQLAFCFDVEKVLGRSGGKAKTGGGREDIFHSFKSEILFTLETLRYPLVVFASNLLVGLSGKV